MELYLFVPGVESKIYTSLAMHLSTLGSGKRAVILECFYGLGHVGCIQCSTLDLAKFSVSG